MSRMHIQIFLISALLLLNFSCAKQESPDIESSEVRTQSEMDRLEACSAVNFNKGVLLHLNMLLLFKCSKWDQEFPKMYQAIKRIQSSSWDHFMAPIDKEFVENLIRRDRVFKNIKDLDAKDGLDDLSRVLVALNETNFFDSVKAMFACVDDPSNSVCSERSKIPAKKSLKNIIKLVDIQPDSIDRASNFVKALNGAIGPNEEKLRVEINKFRIDPVFIEFRLRLVDALAKKVQTGLKTDDREFLSKLLLTGSGNSNEPWVYTWLHDIKMNREKFRDLVEYPILANPDFVGEIKGLKQAYDEGFNCSIKSTMDPNELINFDFKTHLYDYVTVIRKRDYKGYYDFTASELVGLKMSSEICKELVTNKYNTNFIKMLTNLSTFLGEKKFYDLIKFLATQTTASGDLDKTFAENLYLFDMIASDIFSNANLLNENIVKHTRELYPTIFDVAQNLPPEAFLDLGEFLQDIMKQENDVKFVGVADFWNFFDSKEKNFVFNFVDRHFEGDTHYVYLFDFYTKFLDDLRDTQPVFKEKWMGTEANEEMSYLSLQDVFNQLAGRETLLDFQKFFGRDQILKVLEVISNGNNINALAKEELAYRRSDGYLAMARGERYIFKVTYNPKDGDYDSRPVIECLQKFSQIENGFYELVRKLPEACTKVTEQNIAFRLFGWFNSIENSWKVMNPSKVEGDSIFSQRGILSPLMLNTTLGTAKILDILLGDVDSQLPTKNGITYLMNSAKFHLNEQKGAALVDKNLSLLTKWFEVMPQQNLIHRNAVIKEFTREKNFAKANDVTKDLAAMSIQYSEWVKSGKLAQVQKRAFSGEYDPKNDCEKVVNQVVSANPCPSKEVVKKHTNNIVKYLSGIWEKEMGSPIAALLKSVKPGEGLDIPLNGKKTKKYRLTLKETFKYMYDTSDKSFPINRTKTYYVNENGKGSNEILTTLERIEIVIRDVRFDNNYLGVAFLNAVTQAEDYNEEVENRKGLLKKCLKIPVIRCSRKMSDDDLRQAQNALETFDSLSDVNNGRNNGSPLTYGNFLKTFEQTLVGSSAEKAQEVQLMALKDEYLQQHNGKILGDMTAMTMWSNTARIIRDRVGRTREDFNNFINSEAFNRVDKALLYGFELPQAGPSAERLLKKLQVVPSGETQNAIGNTVDWIASLDYNETRLLEDTTARLLLVSAYLGSPEFVFGKSAKDNSYDRYKDNNLFQIFLALEKVIDYWPTVKGYMPADMKLVDALKPVNNALMFLTSSLESTNDPDKNFAYRALNDIFIVAQTVLFDDMSDPKLAKNSDEKVKGIDLAVGFLQNPKLVNQAYTLARDDYRYLDVLHANQASWFKAVGQNLNRIANHARIDLSPVREYLKFTTKSQVCLNRDSECVENYHFDEAAKLVKYLNHSEKFGSETNFMLATRKLLVENLDQLNNMIDDLIPCLKIKEVKPPFQIN